MSFNNLQGLHMLKEFAHDVNLLNVSEYGPGREQGLCTL